VNKVYRLKKNEDFQHTISGKKRLGNSSFTIYLTRNELGQVRVGISTSKKLGIAVVRNRIRRQVRSMIQHRLVVDQSLDLVIIVKNDYLTRSFLDNEQQLLTLIRSLGGSLLS